MLEKVVSESHGESVWEALLEKSGASGTYASLGSYPDEELLALVAAGLGSHRAPPRRDPHLVRPQGHAAAARTLP
ncbi:MAG: heme NO-binding domain-containing protein [Opitutaceae bacterium]